MLNAHIELNRREAEIEEYVSHLEKLEKDVGFSVTLMNTMKSSALLMIYNMVESTMSNLLQDVFDKLEAEKVSFESLNLVMKQLVLNYSKKRSSEKVVGRMQAEKVNLVAACFEKDDLFSGNIDCRKIAETLSQLGISPDKKYEEPVFFKVKTERNSLAHGQKSFSDCGKDYTVNDLREYQSKVKVILASVVKDFENFLSVKAYSLLE